MDTYLHMDCPLHVTFTDVHLMCLNSCFVSIFLLKDLYLIITIALGITIMQVFSIIAPKPGKRIPYMYLACVQTLQN